MYDFHTTWPVAASSAERLPRSGLAGSPLTAETPSSTTGRLPIVVGIGDAYTSASVEVSSTVVHCSAPVVESRATIAGLPTRASGTNTEPPATANDPLIPAGRRDFHRTCPFEARM